MQRSAMIDGQPLIVPDGKTPFRLNQSTQLLLKVTGGREMKEKMLKDSKRMVRFAPTLKTLEWEEPRKNVDETGFGRTNKRRERNKEKIGPRLYLS